MNIFLEKFGTTLISRQSGREAFSAFKSNLSALPSQEKVEVDFKGVITFSPSWGDEFLRPLMEMYPGQVVLKNTENLSVKATLELLEKIGNVKFTVVKVE